MEEPRISLLKKALDALAAAAAAVGDLDEYEIPGSFGDPLDTEQIITGLAEVAGDLRDALQAVEDSQPEPGIEEFDWEGDDEPEDEEENEDDEPHWLRGEGYRPFEDDDGIDTFWPEDD